MASTSTGLVLIKDATPAWLNFGASAFLRDIASAAWFGGTLLQGHFRVDNDRAPAARCLPRCSAGAFLCERVQPGTASAMYRSSMDALPAELQASIGRGWYGAPNPQGASWSKFTEKVSLEKLLAR
jgi:hypothetical protein